MSRSCSNASALLSVLFLCFCCRLLLIASAYILSFDCIFVPFCISVLMAVRILTTEAKDLPDRKCRFQKYIVFVQVARTEP